MSWVFTSLLCSRQTSVTYFCIHHQCSPFTAHVKWLIPDLSSFPPATPPTPPPPKGEIRLEMENKELPREEKAITVRTDVQPNAKNSISLKRKGQKQKQKAFHSLSICNGLIAAEWKQSSCVPVTPLFVLWKGSVEPSKWGEKRAAPTCLKHESSSTVIYT